MARAMSIILGVIFVAMGILGLMGTVSVSMFGIDNTYVSIGEIVLGALGVLGGIFARQ